MTTKTHEIPGVPQEIGANFEPFTLVDMQRIQEQLEELFPKEMDVLRQAGVHPTDHVLRPNPYTGEMDDEVYNNVGQHCLAVAYASSLIAGIVFPNDEVKIAQATSHGLTHNAAKGMEIMRKKAAKIGKFATDPYSVSSYEMVGKVLADKGHSPEFLNYLKNSGKETGHTSLAGFLTLNVGGPELVSGREVDKIVHIADDITWTARKAIDGYAPTYYLPVEQRMAAQDFPNTYPLLYQEGIAFDAAGRSVLIEDYPGKVNGKREPTNNPSSGAWGEWAATAHSELQLARTYAEWQVWEARQMSQELVSRISPESYKDESMCHEFIVGKLNDRLRERHEYFPHLKRISVTG